MPNPIPVETREALYDTLRRYVWCMDTQDVEGVVGVFTADAEITDFSGKRWNAEFSGARGFAKNFLERPPSGGQHWIQPLLIEETTGGYKMTSFWHSIRWNLEDNVRGVGGVGCYYDTFRLEGGEWKMTEKIIAPWNANTAPVVYKAATA
ncbi:MAG: hypothetical protein EXR68_00650 [Dehalococcoidia bacterium]|nr:hypothetical protein [Dehalococcoidia bacterium]